MSNYTEYALRSQEQIAEAMQRATFMFVGRGDLNVINGRHHSNDYYLNSVGYLMTYSTHSSKVLNAYAWDDYRNWVRLENGEIVDDPLNPNEDLPSSSDHVIISVPVCVGGNRRAPVKYKTVQIDLVSVVLPDFSFGDWGKKQTPYYYHDVKGPEEKRGFVYQSPPMLEGWQRIVSEGPLTAGWSNATNPTCASATFLDNTFICVDTCNIDMGEQNGYRPKFVPIGFPCTFYGSSHISCHIGTVTFTNLQTGDTSPETQPQQEKRRYLKFSGPLSFYDGSYIEKSAGAIHPDLTGLNIAPVLGEYIGFVGGVVLNCDVHFYGDRAVELCHFSFTQPTHEVHFHDKVKFGGGIVSNAIFHDKSSRPIGVFIQPDGLGTYGKGPHITYSAEFNDYSVNDWPLFCRADFRDKSLCRSPFFDDTNFYDNSVYQWDNFWAPNVNNGLNNTFWTNGIQVPPLENRTATFLDYSVNYSSKVLTSAPTRFQGDAKLLVPHRFHNGNGYIPSNFSGDFVSLDGGAPTPPSIGNGATDSAGHNTNTDRHFYCEHAHPKSGDRVPLLPNESPVSTHIAACAPFIYAEFHDFKQNGDWGDPDNWTRIGGRPDMLPNVKTIAKIKSGKHVVENRANFANCMGLVIEDGASVDIEFGKIQTLFNYGNFSGEIEEIGYVFMMGNSKNIGTIRQANTTIFTDGARNYDTYTGTDGFLRTGTLLVIPPRPSGVTIGGNLQAPPPTLSDWSNLNYTFFSGSDRPTPETLFYNYASLCFGDFLYQTN